MLGILFMVLNVAFAAYNFSTGTQFGFVLGTVNMTVAFILLMQFLIYDRRDLPFLKNGVS